jgi:hypothetical protein
MFTLLQNNILLQNYWHQMTEGDREEEEEEETE